MEKCKGDMSSSQALLAEIKGLFLSDFEETRASLHAIEKSIDIAEKGTKTSLTKSRSGWSGQSNDKEKSKSLRKLGPLEIITDDLDNPDTGP